LNNAEVHQGPGDLWIIDPAPDDTAIRMTLDEGTPDATAHANSIHLGAIASAITFQATPEIGDITLDQYEAPIAQFINKLDVKIQAELAQTEMEKMSKALGVGVFSEAAEHKTLTFGGVTAVPEFCVAAISPKRTNSALFVVAMLYKTTATGGIKFTISRNNPSFYTVEFTGQQDLTRTAGRQIGVIYETLT
jgi:hypothetical protein